MRQIKFRAFDTKINQLVKSVPPVEALLDNPDHEISEPDSGDVWDLMFFYPNSPLGKTFNNRIVYQQAIGFQDVNKNDIYEGDIVIYNAQARASMYKSQLAKIYWDETQARFMIGALNNSFAWTLDQNFCKEALSLVGNIEDTSQKEHFKTFNEEMLDAPHNTRFVW